MDLEKSHIIPCSLSGKKHQTKAHAIEIHPEFLIQKTLALFYREENNNNNI